MSYFCLLPNRNPNVFVDVLSFQGDGDWIAGSLDSRESHFMDRDQQRSDTWFLFNTRTHERFDAPNDQALAALAIAHGFTLKLESSSEFYDQHRYRWYDAAFALLPLAPALMAAAWLYRKARRLLNEAESTGPAVSKKKEEAMI
ncbi:MAG TPA: hypothetical protein VGM11_16100 [Acidobacteriaceae bacterium]|jgi:hypothetical protein